MIINPETLCLTYNRGNLRPGEFICDGELRIGLSGNTNIKPQTFALAQQDYNPTVIFGSDDNEIARIELPGKSAFLIFDDLLTGDPYEDTCSIIRKVRGRERDKHRDHVHVAWVSSIQAVGWKALYAPLGEKNPFHVLLVPSELPPSESSLALIALAFKRMIPQ